MVTILTELRLGVPLLDHSVIQVLALLRDIDMKAGVWENDNVYAYYQYETSITSDGLHTDTQDG